MRGVAGAGAGFPPVGLVARCCWPGADAGYRRGIVDSLWGRLTEIKNG